ncbi:alpha/beta fold hydrolase [Variovorax sp. KK3]|uniref:alpha/beta fold hydrolase n=1 Tax=Variovorax sp. KK3 TaxID=1855728 RepID=UPI00097C3475|nr:alpha/beta fold hydrolase [Variovorax sp. KK3]
MTLKQTIRFAPAHDGVRLAYALSGNGPPLVKVGNWLTHLEFDLQSPVWGYLVEALSREHRLLRYDQRGTGLSDREVVNWDFEDQVRDLETVIDAAGFDRFALLCISQGTPVGITYAARHPDRVTHLVLHGGYARGRRRRSTDPADLEEADMMTKLMALGWGRNDPAWRQFFTSQFIPRGTSVQHDGLNELQRVSTSPANAVSMLRAFEQSDVTPLLSEVRCPTLVLHATHDLRVPFEESRRIAGGIPQARFVPLDSANHLMVADDPAWPRWQAEVADFLGTRSGEGDSRFGGLTPRERELVELLAQGRDNAQIAAVLGLSDKTVRNHISSIFHKLQVENRGQAIVLARTAGFGTDTSGSWRPAP